ncbi:hypothetical protein PV08_09031 [Exophiala spinifera]|uniref:Enoyl reductase (ER) domain-containing protein n=1 Tax=Exophiala spinifera TaxID=91928 RepID=A0A0D2BKE6_9EURO|nr:uncharacterized protein PV08_09031 [Exophiala spinifera]KIW11759.1 hypothetical protein PV08_09031 [Exophiala spinifera]
MANKAVWLQGPGKEPQVISAPLPKPGSGELLLKVKGIAVQPGEWKIQAGLIPVPLSYPTIIGLSCSGVVEKVGPGVTRFAPGDRVATNTTGVLRNDSRFGAYQRFALTPQALTSKIGETPFDVAASLSTTYSSMSALFIHLNLERPLSIGRAVPKGEKVLIWGISSSFGAIAAQLAQQAGYEIIGVAAGRHSELAKSLGLDRFIDRNSSTVVQDLTSLGPYKGVFAAQDSAEDQIKMGQVLAAHGGGRILSAAGIQPGVELPAGVSGFFHQYLDDFLDPKNKEFVEWVWWDYLEAAFADGRLRSVPLEVKEGLSYTSEAWDLLRHHKVGGKRIIIVPESE